MRHNCEYKEDGELYQPFLDAIISGYIEYDDYFDAYLFFGYVERKFLFWKYGVGAVEILRYCPYCGESLIYEKMQC